MPAPVFRSAAPVATPAHAAVAPQRPPLPADRSFRAVLASAQGSEPAAPPDTMLHVARQMAEDQHKIDAFLRAAQRGAALGQAELLALQARVYRHSQDVDLASRVVEKAGSAIRTTLQSQQ